MGDYGPGRHTVLSMRPKDPPSERAILTSRLMREKLGEKRLEAQERMDEYKAQRCQCSFHCTHCGGSEYADKEEMPRDIYVAPLVVFLCACGEVVEHRIHEKDTTWVGGKPDHPDHLMLSLAEEKEVHEEVWKRLNKS